MRYNIEAQKANRIMKEAKAAKKAAAVKAEADKAAIAAFFAKDAERKESWGTESQQSANRLEKAKDETMANNVKVVYAKAIETGRLDNGMRVIKNNRK